MNGPRSGDRVTLTRTASAQFAAGDVAFRVIRQLDQESRLDGWVWLDGYQLDSAGRAVERRSVFIRLAGLTPTPSAPVT